MEEFFSYAFSNLTGKKNISTFFITTYMGQNELFVTLPTDTQQATAGSELLQVAQLSPSKPSCHH